MGQVSDCCLMPNVKNFSYRY